MNSLLARLRRYFVRRQDDRRNERAEDFLKALLEAGGTLPRSAWDEQFARLALELDTAAQTLGRLALEGRVDITAEASPHPRGRRDALALMRAHRIYEQYLAEHSGYAPAEWHERAHHMEHRLDARERERMASLLGNPLFDPHGDPIPTAGLALPALPAGARDTAAEGLPEAGTLLRVVHIEDDDARRFGRIAATGCKTPWCAWLRARRAALPSTMRANTSRCPPPTSPPSTSAPSRRPKPPKCPPTPSA